MNGKVSAFFIFAAMLSGSCANLSAAPTHSFLPRESSFTDPVYSSQPRDAARIGLESARLAPSEEALAAAKAALANFHVVNSSLYRSGRPDASGILALKGLGVKSILSLEQYVFDPETADAEAAAAKVNGMQFYRVPMSGVWTPQPKDIDRALAVITNPANQPVLVHCYYGSDRTGIVVAAYHIKVDHWSVSDATEDMYRYGHSDFLSWWDDVLDEI